MVSLCALLGPLLLLLVVGRGSDAHEAVFGSCPIVKPMGAFNMQRFEGRWFVIRLFDPYIDCMVWDISRDGKFWRILETKSDGLIRSTSGKLYPDPKKPSQMIVSWSNNLNYPFTVFTTDYTSYAGVFQCQKIVFFNRQQGVVLSRTPVMPIQLQQMVIGKLYKYEVETSYFHKVDQAHCVRTPTTTTTTTTTTTPAPLEGPPGPGEGGDYPDFEGFPTGPVRGRP